MRRALLVAAAALLGCTAAVAEEAPPPLTAIESLDVARYMGRWYEIARYPNRFQRQCVGEASADYRQQPDDSLAVINRCRLADGRLDEAVGEARQLGGPASPRLRVRFAPAWLSFLPLVWGDYWVVALDADYRWAAVGEPSRRFLWVLARTPTLDAPTLAEVHRQLRAKGFDPARLVTDRQPADR
jgi:apolipoprotein D and lipocalin family protein